MKKKSFKWFAIFIMVMLVVTGWYLLLGGPKEAYTEMDKGQIIRLHVIANSDSDEDQAVKLKVRDAVVEYLTPSLVSAKTIDESRTIIMEQKDTLLSIAQQILTANNKHYAANLEIGWFDFPVKSYGTMVFPAGKYEALRIMLGKAEGKNWWCVLFPPLCFIDGANATAVPISAKTADEADEQPANIEFRFKFAEMFH